MIDILTNGFLNNPAPIQFTGNYCSHGCSYCFANINNPKRKLEVKEVVSQIKNHQNRNDLPSFYLREKYPVLISNNMDPFSKSNQPFANDLIRSLADLDIPVVIATRGGYGWREIAGSIKPTVFYVSIPYTNDAIRNIYESNAPAVNERWELVEEVISLGHQVIISINPLNRSFTTDPISIISRAQKLGVRSIVINRLHLNNKQQSNLTRATEEIIGEDLLKQARQRDFDDDWLSTAMHIFEYCKSNDLNLLGMDTGLANSNFIEFKDCYPKLLPTIDDFFNWCWSNKKEGDLIYFSEFYNYFTERLPTLKANISKYIFNRAVISDKDFYKVMDLRNLLHLYWQHPKVGLGLAKHYPSFGWAKKQYANKLDFVFDDNHNQVLYYNRENFNSSESIIIE